TRGWAELAAVEWIRASGQETEGGQQESGNHRQLFLRGGYSVMLYDVICEQLGGAMSAVVEKLRVMEKEGLLREGKTWNSSVFEMRTDFKVKWQLLTPRRHQSSHRAVLALPRSLEDVEMVYTVPNSDLC
ncbi:hypothetical protein GBAR_LOCUS27455, partial [Geodia barretti]